VQPARESNDFCSFFSKKKFLRLPDHPCPVCLAGPARLHRPVDGIDYFSCDACGSLFADPAFMARVDAGELANYQTTYWESELQAARARGYGVSLARVAETIRMCRLPIARFIDIGTGAGFLLDALAELLPELSDRFYGIEAFPPALAHRSPHAHYRLGTLGTMNEMFEAGVCIEVIEHLSPATLRGLVAQLAARARPGALFLFNSAQPGFVEARDPAYLDPLGRGHIVAYSIAGATSIFAPSGFNIITLPGRQWAFMAEYGVPAEPAGTEALLHRLWAPHPENIAMLEGARFGPLMIALGLDAARVYLEHATSNERTAWAQALGAQLDRQNRRGIFRRLVK
jgi:2-polyprenyl-3-methyl-5-hydroxy-6-metoxy-1,4-benzoquinol methylase